MIVWPLVAAYPDDVTPRTTAPGKLDSMPDRTAARTRASPTCPSFAVSVATPR